MDLFEKLTKTGQELADKAKDVYDVNVINLKISSEQKMLNRRYIALAKKYLEKYADEIDADFEEEVEKINQHIDTIEDYKLQKAVVKGNKLCEGCGRHVDDKAEYCPGCGKKL